MGKDWDITKTHGCYISQEYRWGLQMVHCPSISNKDIEQQIEDSRSNERNGEIDEEQWSHYAASKNSLNELIREKV